MTAALAATTVTTTITAATAPSRPTVNKLVRMLKLAARHKGTHLALGIAAAIALSYYSSRRAAALAARKRAIERMLSSHTSRPASRVHSAADLRSLDSNSPLAVRRSSSMASLTMTPSSSKMLRRRPSEVALAELTATRIVCDACLSRCATHESLTRLDEEEDEEGDDGEIASALEVCPPVNSSSPTSRCDSRPPEAIDSATAAALASSSSSSSSDDYAVCSSCEVCNEVQTTWRTLLKYAFGISLSTGLSYILWLRFIASRETVRKHVFTAARILGERLFNYSVLDSKKIPTTGPALLTVYADQQQQHSQAQQQQQHTATPLTHPPSLDTQVPRLHPSRYVLPARVHPSRDR